MKPLMILDRPDMALSIFIRGLAVSTSVALLLAVLPWFHPSCQPFLKRLVWFFIRYAVPAYCLILMGELIFWSNH